MPGLSDERAAFVKGRIGGGPWDHLTSIDIVDVAAGYAVVRLSVDEKHMNSGGVMHGGMTASLVDTAATAAAWADDGLPDGVRGGTAALTVTYLAPVTGGVLEAVGTVVRRGKRLVVVDVVATREDGEAIAKGLITYSFSPPKT